MAGPAQWASQAKINAMLRYAPDRETLRELAQTAKEQYASTVSGAESTGRLTGRAVEKAIPNVQGIYNRQQQGQTSTQSALAAALSALGPGADGYKAAAATEGAAGQERAGRERASTEGNLQEQLVAAREAPAFARTLAGQQLATALSKIFSKSQGLAGQEGLAAASESAKLQNQDEGRKLTERGQNLSHQSAERGHDITEKDAAQKAAEKAAGKPLSQKEMNEAASTIAQIRQYAAEGGGNRKERVTALTEGRPEQTHKNAKGEFVKLPKIPAFKPNAQMAAALDWAELGHLTPSTEKRLRAEGIDPAKIGVPRMPRPQAAPRNHTIATRRP